VVCLRPIVECSKIVKREKRCFSIHGHALSRTQLCKRRRAKQTDETRCKCQRATRSNESLGLWALLKSAAAAVRMRIDIKCCLRVAQFSLSLSSADSTRCNYRAARVTVHAKTTDSIVLSRVRKMRRAVCAKCQRTRRAAIAAASAANHEACN
jgi:hypothetical protein